ncbi:dihydrodipicolinate synthase family protein [Maricaulis sp.]|jgi:1-pyrroline-4-hydroxy-2-carboxylate deaminase|uniref:dihydrodipicolinate synthase family protein n=1 Tax=Maricaulis sp. TaxID=1486257 RepID=UPI0026295CEF|nr:dihydrodipicolinate synthase family protein [Maricaulis sp.]MDF1768730.1 dihydrodipicolinate synthase family protein [Maricaulis sp.]
MTTANWSGVFPAATTQFSEDFSVDLDATAAVVAGLVEDGVHGLIAMGTVGENNSLTAEEKRQVLARIVDTVDGRIPVLTGVSELTTDLARSYAVDAARIGADGLMLLPAMVYVPTEAELEAHIRTVAGATSLPVMLYNNPPAYRVSISLDTLERLADVETLVAIKESAPDPRRITDILNRCGDRYLVFAGLDDVALEEILLGAVGWVSGLTNAFPAESIALWDAVESGDLETARAIYRWFMPLLHLDAEHDLVQSIKLAEQVMGRGSERVRMPRMPLSGDRRAAVIEMVETARDTRPLKLPSVLAH